MKDNSNIITSKDLLCIEDMLNFNLIMNKKIYSLYDCVDNENVKKLMFKIKTMHSKHYKELINLID